MPAPSARRQEQSLWPKHDWRRAAGGEQLLSLRRRRRAHMRRTACVWCQRLDETWQDARLGRSSRVSWHAVGLRTNQLAERSELCSSYVYKLVVCLMAKPKQILASFCSIRHSDKLRQTNWIKINRCIHTHTHTHSKRLVYSSSYLCTGGPRLAGLLITLEGLLCVFEAPVLVIILVTITIIIIIIILVSVFVKQQPHKL